MQEPTKFLNSGTCSTKQLTTSISTCVWRPGRLSETECATLSDFPLFVGALTTKSWTPEGGPKNYVRCFFSCKQMQLCIVSFCLAFRFNRFVQIPSHPLMEFARHGKLDTVCLSRCRNVFRPLEWVVSCAGGQLKFWPSLLNLSQAMVMHPSYESWRNQDKQYVQGNFCR